MDFKFCVFLLLVCVSLAVAGKFNQQKIDQKCGTNEACHSAAKRCLGKEAAGGLSHYEKLPVFNKCLDDNGQSGLRINEANCVEEGASGGAKTGESLHHNCQKEIFDILASLEESVAAPVRCCYATAVKSEKVKSDGSLNEDYFRNLIKLRIEEQTIKDIIENVVTSCLPKGANCNVHGFIECGLDKCIEQVLAIGT